MTSKHRIAATEWGRQGEEGTDTVRRGRGRHDEEGGGADTVRKGVGQWT